MLLKKSNVLTYFSSVLLLSLIASAQVKENNDPCNPSPCGKNSICVLRNSNLVSCICEEGFRQSSGDGCTRVFAPARGLAPTRPPPATKSDDENVNNDENEGPSRFGSARDRPRAINPGLDDTPRRVNNINSNNENIDDDKDFIGNNNNNRANAVDDFGVAGSVGAAVNIVRESQGGRNNNNNNNRNNVRFESESRPKGSSSNNQRPASGNADDTFRPQFERNPFERPSFPENPEDIDNLFPEECLVHEDCVDKKFCDADNTCKNICDQPNVCGPKANCKAVLHRPLCFCEPDHTGNPYKGCTKRPSRVGLRFKRR